MEGGTPSPTTGFGLLGHALEMRRGPDRSSARVRCWLPGVQAYAADGVITDPALFAQMALFLHLQVDLPLHQRRIGVQSDVLRPFLGRGVALGRQGQAGGRPRPIRLGRWGW